MVKPKSIKNHPQFVLLFTPKTPQKSLFTPSTYILLSITLVLASILCFMPFVIKIHTSTHSPLLLASISSVYQDPNADDNNSPVTLSVPSIVPLPPRSVAGTEFWDQPDGEGYRPCLGFSLKYRRRSVKIVNEKKRFLVVVVSGGLLQIRNQIVDAVIIARILEASLVLPVLKGDESEFSEIFDVEHFRKTLKADIRVASSLPSTRSVSWQSLENQIPHNVPPFWIRARFFKKLNEDGSLVLTGLDSKLSKNLSPDLQKLKCKVAFHALKFAKPVRDLGNRIARRMWIEGPYVAVHLSLEKELWVRTGCPTGLGPEYDVIISEEERESSPEFLATNSNTNCPLNALEAARYKFHTFFRLEKCSLSIYI
ncbi:putative GDP-fucose protein O-fucosyltransferase [Helianthus anomalus]